MDRSIPDSPEAQLADQVWGLLVRVAHERVHGHVGAAAAEFDLAPAQAFALGELDIDRPMAMRELAGRLKCDPSNITGLIDRLEARGLVERQAHPSDRRVRFVVLTAQGRAVRNRLAARVFAAPTCMACLSDREQKVLHDALLRVLEGPDRT